MYSWLVGLVVAAAVICPHGNGEQMLQPGRTQTALQHATYSSPADKRLLLLCNSRSSAVQAASLACCQFHNY
jgi:hypothetical protein